MNNLLTKTKPIPTRFEPAEDQFIKEISNGTGLPVSEIVRRAVRLMHRQKQIVQTNSFVLELTALG